MCKAIKKNKTVKEVVDKALASNVAYDLLSLAEVFGGSEKFVELFDNQSTLVMEFIDVLSQDKTTSDTINLHIFPLFLNIVSQQHILSQLVLLAMHNKTIK